MDYFEGSALVKQIGTLFENMLRQKRDDRAMEFVKGLHEVLFVHWSEIGSSDTIIEQLLMRVPATFQHSVSLGLEVFRMIYDIELGDQHEKRRRCMSLLLEVAELTASPDIIGEMRGVVQDQLSSSSECVRQAVQRSLTWIKSASPALRQMGLDVFSMLVHSCPLQLRAQKDATRELRPSFLLQQALTGSSSAFRTGAARLIADIVRGGVSDISFEGACDIASEVESALYGEDKKLHFGALVLLKEFMSCRNILGANWNWRKCATCLLTTDWGSYADDECVLSLQVLAHLTRFDIDCEEIVDGLLRILQANRNLKHAAAACDGLVFLFDSNATSMQKVVGRIFDTLRVHLPQSNPAWSSLLGLVACLSKATLPSALKALLHKVVADTDVADIERGTWLARLSSECGGWSEVDQEVFAVFNITINVQNEATELSTSIIAAKYLRRTATVIDITCGLDHSSVDVRRETVLSLISLSEELVLQNTDRTTAKRLDSVVTKIIEKLLDSAVVDREVSVRLTILQGLRNSFDAYLSLPDHIEALCMARNDISQTVRDEAVRILCRLLPSNPAFVHPQLLRAQEELVKEIETKDAAVGAVFHCARQLRLMITDNTVLVQTKPIEVCTIDRLDRQCFVSRLLTVELLRLFASVLDVSGNTTQHCDLSQAVQVLLRILQDGANNLIRCTAVETLCCVVGLPSFSPTDYILSRIFSVIGTILRDDRNEDDELRRQAPRVIAVIGGFHPARLRALVSSVEGSEGNLLENIAALRPHPRYRPHIDETFPSTVVYLLLKVTITAADPKIQLDALGTLGEVLVSAPDNQKAALVPHVVPTFRRWLQEPEKSHLRSAILSILTDFALLLRKFKEVMGTQVGNDILQSVQSLCALPEASQKPLNVLIVRLLDVLAIEMPVQDMREHRWAVEFILQRLSQDKEDSALVLQVVKSLDSLMNFLRDRDSRNVLPQVLQCIDAFQDRQVNRSCFDFIGGIIEKQPSLAKDCCAQIVHTSVRFIEEIQSIADIELPLNTLANLITTVAQRAARFIPPIQAAARVRGLGPETFEKALAAASQGLHKVKIPVQSPEVFKPDATIHVVSSIRLTQKEFENELSTAIRVQSSDFEVLGISHPGGQTVITFRFHPNDRAEVNVASFAKRAIEPQSALRRNLAIVNVFQKEDTVVSCPADFIMCLRQLPEGRKRKRELPWILWLTSLSNWFLRMSPHKALKSIAGIASGNHELSKNIFPFAAGSFVKAASMVDRKVIMTSLAHALTKAPYDIRQAIFSFAEFIEVERGEQRQVLVKCAKKVSCDVERENPDQKFGINYDQESRGIVVSKLAPDGLGARAGVPVNAVLLSINGTQVKSVQQIRTLIAGLNKIQLVLQTVVEERQESEPVPMIDIATLANVALEAQMHAKAVYFNEILLQEQLQLATQHRSERRESESLLSTVEKLIELYNFVGIPMEGKGVVRSVSAKLAENVLAPERFGFDEAATLEKLQWWNEALRQYSARPSSENSSLVGMLRCYDALGDFDLVLDMDDRVWSQLDSKYRPEFGRLRANAAFALGKWEIVDEVFEDTVCASHMDGVVLASALFKRKRFDELLKHCREQRESLFEKYCEHFSDSMIRANDIVVEMQHFSHFEELVSFSQASEDRRALLKSLWRKRLGQMSKKPVHWKTTVAINSLVLSQDEDMTSRVECALVCSKHGWVRYAEHLLKSLMNVTSLVAVPNLSTRDPQIIHAYLKHTYLSGRRQEAREMISAVLNAVGVEPSVPQPEVWSKCWMLMGEWSAQDSPLEATVHLKNATQLSAKNANAFHALGVLHQGIARSEIENSRDSEALVHVVEGMSALFSSVQLSDRKNSVTQDLLRILTLWFQHGDTDAVDSCFQRGVASAPNHVWLRVIPQLVARIGIASFKTREQLGKLLIKVGSQFPQAFMYPLHVSEKSTESLRQSMAAKVLDAVRSQHELLIREAISISQELERMAILWPEKWHAQIQAAAARQDNSSAVLATLQQLFDELDHPSTPHERNFEKSYGQLLKRAKTALTQQPQPSLESAWQSLKQVWQQLNSKALAERKLNMSEVSPILDSLKNSSVCVPGTFDPWRPAVHISHFNGRINVLTSKQKPRKFGVVGSDGKQYHFLLKGHEDLRQDERVMQFIELVNSIFSFDAGSMAQGLSITSYAVVPLSDNVGIIGWVEDTETIFKMIETRRKEHNISIYEEVNMMIKRGGMATIDEYHKLPKVQRKTLLSHVLSSTPADELSKIIWTTNNSCEEWLEYRRVFANTLATMSMVGYVLGLGDRHLNNLMLQTGGAVVHIDFGDCFEVAMHRQHFAEAVPFRLTRFLVAPLGVSGPDGSYRHTCEHVMKLLRRHRENLLSILEAFIFDPLINWTISANVRIGPSETGDTTTALASSVKLREPQETEKRNQQADSALLRVKAKLSGEDFGGPAIKPEKEIEHLPAPTVGPASYLESTLGKFSDSPKDSVVGGLLPTYLLSEMSRREALDVPSQVARLIAEATSLDNLAEAYVTGWAPFW